MAQLVESVPDGGPPGGRGKPLVKEEARSAPPEVVEENPWPHAAKAGLLSIFFPGCGHLYVGRPLRGVLWSIFFVAGVLPAALFAYVVLASFSPAVLARTALVVFALLLLCALGPFLAALRHPGLRRDPPARPIRPPSLPALGAYAAAVTFVVALETVWFLQTFLGGRGVETSSFEPVLSRGDRVTVVFSRYIRPVHGDIVLFETGPSGAANQAGGRLGRVLAKPGDSVELREGSLLVNGIAIDLRRNDQRKALEKAGRAERRWRLIPGIGPATKDVPQDEAIEWPSEPRGPSVLPARTLLVLPDGPAEPGAEGGERPPGEPSAPRCVLIPESTLIGRVIF